MAIRAARLRSVGIWVRLLVGIGLMLAITWTVFISYATWQQRNIAFDQALEFTDTVNQMTLAGLATMMWTNTMSQRHEFLDQIRELPNVSELRVLRAEATDALFGPGLPGQEPTNAIEREVLRTGERHIALLDGGVTLYAVIPNFNDADFLGKTCVGCHGAHLEGEVLGAVSMQVSLAEVRAATTRFRTTVLGIAVMLSLAFMFTVYLFIERVVTRPVRAMATNLDAIGAGNLNIRVASTRRDEVGRALQSVAIMVERLRSTIRDIRALSAGVGAGASEIAKGNADLSQRTEEQASSLEETASSMEELTSTVKQNADNARQANQLATATRDIAAQGGQKASAAMTSMEEITASADKIADIITVIDGIAFQTNILALNAAVEAARAGEQGRGFAVVAGEVRSLAQRSASAAKEIKALIGNTTSTIDAGSKLVMEAGQTMAEIVTQVKRVSDLIAEISAASEEQSSGIEQVNTAITQMDEVTQQNAALVEQAAAAAESLEEQARELMQAVSLFEVDESFGDVFRSSGTLPGSSGPVVLERSDSRTPRGGTE